MRSQLLAISWLLNRRNVKKRNNEREDVEESEIVGFQFGRLAKTTLRLVARVFEWKQISPDSLQTSGKTRGREIRRVRQTYAVIWNVGCYHRDLIFFPLSLLREKGNEISMAATKTCFVPKKFCPKSLKKFPTRHDIFKLCKFLIFRWSKKCWMDFIHFTETKLNLYLHVYLQRQQGILV